MSAHGVLLVTTGLGSQGGIERVSAAAARVLEIPTGLRVVLLEGEASAAGAATKLAFLARLVLASLRRRPRSALVCHASLLPPVAVLATVLKWRVCLLVHGYEVWRPLSPLRRWAIRRADVVLAGSRYTADRLAEQVPGLHVGELSYPTETRPDTARTDAPVVLSVARLSSADAYKGVDILVEAFSAVLAQRQDARLRIVGDGDLRPTLEQRAKELGIGDAVTFLGRVSDEHLAAEYAGASLFALPGRAGLGPDAFGEGFGIVFLEAAAHGLPCIAGRGGGAGEAVIDGATGWLVDGTDVEEVAARIVELLDDGELRRRMGDEGRRRAREEHSPERFARQLRTALALDAGGA